MPAKSAGLIIGHFVAPNLRVPVQDEAPLAVVVDGVGGAVRPLVAAQLGALLRWEFIKGKKVLGKKGTRETTLSIKF